MYIIKLIVYRENQIFLAIRSAPVTIRWEICMHDWQSALAVSPLLVVL